MKNTKQSRILWIGITMLISNYAMAQSHYSLELSSRTKPYGTNLLATAAADKLLWGKEDKSNPIYGYGSIGAQVGGSPTAAIFAKLAPIAPIIFEVQKSKTYRFIKSSEFDCSSNQCLSSVDRTDYSVKLLAGYKNLVGSFSALWRDVKSKETTKPTALELEYFSVPAGTHRFIQTGAIVGYKTSNQQFFGFTLNNGYISNINKKFTNYYGLYHFEWKELNWLVGAGHYQTNEANISGNGALISISKNFGESLGL